MSFIWLQQQLRRVTYKPGYSLSVVSRDDENFGYLFGYRNSMSTLVIKFDAPDSRHPGRTIPVQGNYAILPSVEEECIEQAFIQFVENCLIAVERHEALEWFRVDGELVKDPHAS